MRHWTTGDRPLRDDFALLKVDDCDVAFTVYNVPHSYVHFFPRRLDCHACGIASGHFHTAHHFTSLGIDYVDGSATVHVVVGATVGYIDASFKSFQGVRCKDLNGGIKQMGIRIVSPVISSPIRIAKSSQRDSLGYLVRCPADAYNAAVFQVQPDFVGTRKVDGFLGTRRQRSLMDGLAYLQVHND